MFGRISLALLFIVGCKTAASTNSTTKELIVANKTSAWRYWMTGEGEQQEVRRASCPAGQFDAQSCVIDQQHTSATKLREHLEYFLQDDFIPFVDMSIKQAKDDKLEALAKNLEATKAYAISIKEKAVSLEQLIAATDVTIWEAGKNDVELANYRKPLFYLARAFQKAGMGIETDPADDTVIFDWTRLGGTITLALAPDIASNKDSVSCWADGKVTLHKNFKESLIKTGIDVACCVNMATSSRPKAGVQYQISVQQSGSCLPDTRCLQVDFTDPNAKKVSSLECSSPSDVEFFTVGELKAILGSSIDSVGMTQ